MSAANPSSPQSGGPSKRQQTFPSPNPDEPLTLTSIVLVTSLFLYSVCYLILAVASTVAWSQTRKWVSSADCQIHGVYCGFSRWALYLFISVAAFVCFIITALMTRRSLMSGGFNQGKRDRIVHARDRFYRSYPTRDPADDAPYIFRGVLLTLAILAPLIYCGWSDVTVIGPERCEANISPNATLAVNTNSTVMFEGISGVFIIEVMDQKIATTKIAFILAHFTL